MTDSWYDQIVHIPTGPHAQSRAEQTARELYGPHVVVDQVGWDPRADELLFGVTEEES
jgi:hypothetical protein